jgi:hypothetical protein
LGDAGAFDRRGRAVGPPRPAERVEMDGTAHQHHFLDREREGRRTCLRHIGEAARSLGSREGGEIFAVDRRLSAVRAKETEQGADQGGRSA